MKNLRAILTSSGGPEVLQLQEDDVPEPGVGQLLIRVHFAGVAFADVMQRHGQYPGAPKLPYTPGYDVVGIVEAAGEGTRLTPGTRIAALTRFGGYARFVIVEERGVAVVPHGLASEKAVCMVLNYVSAYQMLHRVAKLQAGQTILVHGAAGGVGTAALQLGRAAGLRLLGTASAKKQDLVRELGATAIDYQHQDFVQEVRRLHPSGIDAVLDPISPENWKRSKGVLKTGGHLVGYGGVGLMSRETDRFTASTMSLVRGALLLKLLAFRIHFTFYGISVRHPERIKTDLEAILAMASQGRLDPVISAVLPLERVSEAHRLLAAAQVRGKLVLDCR